MKFVFNVICICLLFISNDDMLHTEINFPSTFANCSTISQAMFHQIDFFLTNYNVPLSIPHGRNQETIFQTGHENSLEKPTNLTLRGTLHFRKLPSNLSNFA